MALDCAGRYRQQDGCADSRTAVQMAGERLHSVSPEQTLCCSRTVLFSRHPVTGPCRSQLCVGGLDAYIAQTKL